MLQHQTGFSVVLGIGQKKKKNRVLRIAQRMFQPWLLWRQSAAELGSLKYERQV